MAVNGIGACACAALSRQEEIARLLLDMNQRGSAVAGDVHGMFDFFADYSTWLAAAALAIMTKHTVDGVNKAIRRLEVRGAAACAPRGVALQSVDAEPNKDLD